jgi:hypothetical protein
MTVNNSQLDPVNKLRTSSPQALIDTDFEYGTQVSKWENLALTNNRPFVYSKSTAISFTGMTISGRTVTVTLASTLGLSVGSPIVVTDSFVSIANGTFVIDTISTNTNFTYTARATSTLAGGTSINDVNKTNIVQGAYYTASQINSTDLTGSSSVGTNTITSDAATGASKITVAMSNAHGLSIGNEIQIISATSTETNASGAFYVAQVISPTSFAYYSRATVAAAVGGTADFKIYARAQGAVLHRPFDGGVIFSSNGGSNYEQQIRQTRRYFRYQSGKGIQMSSGTILKPNFQVDTMSYAASTGVITITLKDVHNLQTVPPDAQIVIYGANEAGFNGSYYVTNVINYNTFTVTPAVGLFTADTTASGNYYVSTSGWYGAINRLGIFDQQNGLFFEFDGQTLYVVRRNSTYQLAGRGKVVKGSTAVAASTLFTSTSYTKQLTGGDFIVIKGQSYRVESVTDDSNFTISPAYRGASADNVTISKTIDVKIPQSQWNLNKMDGTGYGENPTSPAGYMLDLTKMQMFYIDFSWYGAGFIRWGLRGNDGDVTYVHKMQNNNVNAEAYMRSGNLPGRYESGTIPPVTSVTKAIASTDTVITVADTSKFPTTGTLYIKNYNTVEHVYYSGKTATSFTGVTRAKAGNTTGATVALTAGSNVVTVSTTGLQVGQRVISTSSPSELSDNAFITSIGSGTVTLSQSAITTNATATLKFIPMSATSGQAFTLANPTTVELGYPTLAPTISHWGTSVIMDGRFDDDKSLLFTYGQTTSTNLAPTAGTSVSGVTANVSANTNITIPANLSIVPGMSVSASGGTNNTVPANTIVSAVVSPTVIQLSNAVNVGGAAGSTLSFTGASTKALFSIRISPSVDNGKASYFGARELINRMQLVLRTLDIALQGSTTGNLLVTAVLNGTPTSTVTWSPLQSPTSSLAQISDFSSIQNAATTVTGGEVTGGFFVNSTGSVDLSLVRDLGNAVLGGGATSTVDNSNSNIYPDGPDTLTIVVQNLSGTTAASVVGRIAWTEAQA